MKLFQEEIDLDRLEYIKEDILDEEKKPTGKKAYYIVGPMADGDVKNGNGRTYPFREVLTPMINEYSKKLIDRDLAYGELDHPPTATVSYKNAALLIKEMKPVDLSFIGKARILDNPNGQILISCIDAGGKIGMSTRALGNLDENKIVTAGKMLAVDAVTNPSGPNCIMNAVMENKEYIIDSTGGIMEIPYENLEEALKILPLKDKISLYADALHKFFEELKNA